ncbi:MAG: M20 family metallopeptidase [Deltaproteobacteria bacterium]|nr:M20 family metallopeptidase [Deltaproteobacteria bacterium]
MEACLRKQGVCIVLVFFVLLAATSARADAQKKVVAGIDSASGNARRVSQQIFDFKELGQQEFKSSSLLMEELRKLGFSVTGDLKVPDDLIKDGISKTAFRAELQGKGPGPTITIMLEYDALKNGHACGHNLIATSGLMAAAGLADVMKETPGRILVIGTPDEERGSLGGGKVALLEGGHFDGTDVVLITHGFDRWTVDQRILAMKRATFVFRGKSAHAAQAPHKGINALRGVIFTFNGVDMLREHVRQDVRIHGIIKKGGEMVNVVPELAEAEFAVRALDTGTMEAVYQKVVNCARAAELVTGAKLEFSEPRSSLKAPIIVPAYTKMVIDQVRTLGIPGSEIKDQEDFASSDLGNVGFTYPTTNLWFKIAPEGTALHSDAFREYAASDDGWKATVIAAKAIALTAYDLLTHPDKVKGIQDKFKELKSREGN